MISARIMSDCLRDCAGRDESHPAGSKALPLTNSSVWWQKAQPGKLSPMEPQQPSPRLRCVGHTWRCTQAVSRRKILFSPWLNGAVPPRVLCVLDVRKDCRDPLIFGISSGVKIISNSKISLKKSLSVIPAFTKTTHWDFSQALLSWSYSNMGKDTPAVFVKVQFYWSHDNEWKHPDCFPSALS